MAWQTNRMKQLLREGKAVYSCTVAIPHPNLAEIAGLAGYECVMLDGEHGTVSSGTLDAMILASYAGGSTPIFRAPSLDTTLVKQALDHGAGGILFPHIRTVEDAKQAVALCKYRPEGRRGVGPGRPIGYGLGDPKAYVANANDNMIVALMIEEPQAVENLEAIAAVPGIDIFNMGPWDLSTAYGFPIEERHPLVVQAFEKALKLGQRHGIAVGVSPTSEQDARDLYRQGARFFEAVSVESFLAAALSSYRKACNPG
ncbi:MAG: siderophore biosynthesis protein SbnG [Acidimicrobiia bacterium]|nr:siderophore biosynthesis protein SbnG [Acidimicrobiia bacterium]